MSSTNTLGVWIVAHAAARANALAVARAAAPQDGARCTHCGELTLGLKTATDTHWQSPSDAVDVCEECDTSRGQDL